MPSNVDFLLQYAQAELQKRMETESIELRADGVYVDDGSTQNKSNFNTNANLNNPIFSQIAGAHWALSGDLGEIRAKWENMKIKHSSSGSPIVIEDTMRSRGGCGSKPNNNNNSNPYSAPPPNSPPHSAKHRIRRGRTISSSNGNRERGSMSPPARSASPCKDDTNASSENIFDGLEAYGFSLEASKDIMDNRDLKSRGGSRGASRNSSSRGASSRPTSCHHQRSQSANATSNSKSSNNSSFNNFRSNNNNNNNNNDDSNNTAFKLRPLTAPKSVMFHDDIDDNSSILSANIMRVEVGYQSKNESYHYNNSNHDNSLILIGQQHIRKK